MLRPLCRGISIRSLMGFPCGPQVLSLSHPRMPQVFCYSWLLTREFSLMRKWAFRISELVFSVSLWLWLLAMMRFSTVDCLTYLLGYLLWAYLCQFLCSEYLCHKYFVDFHVCFYLDCLLGCMWVFLCVMLWCTGWNICFVCVSFYSDWEWVT